MKKRAYAYIRISDEDQSNFSLSGQPQIIQYYADKHEMEIVKFFTDDGVSAKSFNRPQWKLLEAELYKNRNTVKYLLIMKYDRLIRYTLQGLTFIEKLEQQWGIRLISVMEDYAINPEDPEFVSNRLQKLIDAEKERHRISDRVRMGNWAAKCLGRFIGTAPLGYDNARDETDRPIIVVNEQESRVVQQVFEDFINEVPYTMIQAKMRKAGHELKGHSSLHRMLSNYTYAGLINVRAYKDQVQHIRKAKHDPIIPEDTFWKAYYKLKDKIRHQGRLMMDDKVPLRGFLLCQKCGKPHTGGKSKGRSAFYYYYRCKCSTGENYSATGVHDWMEEVLKKLSLDKDHAEALKIVFEQELEREMKERAVELPSIKKRHALASANLSSLEKKFIENKINQEQYDKWFPVFNKELLQVNDMLTHASRDKDQAYKTVHDNIQYLGDLNYIYMGLDIPGKHDILSDIFIGGLTKEKTGGRTGMINDLFYEKALLIGDLLRIEKKKTDFSASLSRRCTRRELSRTNLEAFLTKISKVINRNKAA